MNFLILAGLIIVIALAVYAGWLCYRVWHLGQARRERDRSRQEAVLAGLDVVGRALLQEQMNVTEAALRMAALLDNLVQVPEPVVDLAPIRQLAEDAMQFETGASREALPRAERQRQDSEREKLEAEQGDAVLVATRRLVDALPVWRGEAL